MPVSVGELLAYLRLDSSGFDRGIRVAQTEMRTATGTADRMGAAVGVTGERLTGAGRAAQVAASGSAKYRAAQLSLVAAQERYNAALNQGNASTGKLASSEAAVIRANERVAASGRSATTATAGLADAQRGANAAAASTASGFGRAARSAVGLGAAFGAFELAKKAIDIGKEASQFQKSMLLIQTQAGASAGEVKAFSSQVLDMAGQVATSPEKLATSLYHVYSTGLRAGKAMDVVRIAAEGAKVGNADLEETTNALTATVVSGISGVKDMGSAMGMLNSIVGAGDMKLSDLNDALAGGILTAAKGFGVSLQEVGAALAVFGDNNVRGADAATQLRMSILALAKAPKGGQAALDGKGLSAARLKNDMASGGLTKAIDDLTSHMSKAGITGKKVGGFILDAFGRKAGIGLSTLIEQAQRFHIKLSEIGKGGSSFADSWKAATQTTAFQFAKIGVEADSAGIVLVQKVMPAVAGVAGAIGRLLPAAVGVAHGALMPFVAGWHMLASVLSPVAGALGAVLSALSPALPVVKAVAGGVLAMWVAFKGYQVAKTALFAVQDGIARMATGTRNGLATMRAEFGATNAQMATQSAVMRAEFASVEAAALADAAATDRAAAMKAVAYSDMAAASAASSDAQVAAADAAATAALLQAQASAEAAAASGAAATEAAAEIDTAGAAASVGWKAMLGPLGLAAIGVLTIASMFHRSSDASKEATAAAKAYTEALKTDDTTGGTLFDTIVSQLKDNNIPQRIAELNKEFKNTGITASGFAHAIDSGGKSAETMRGRLEKLIKTAHNAAQANVDDDKKWTHYLEQERKAEKLLKSFSTQYETLSKATKKDLIDTKAFAGVSSSIDKVSQSTRVASGVAKKYAEMLGIAVDKNGVAAVSSKTLTDAVSKVSKAYATASGTGDDFLKALDTFSQSAGTAADRAALIGSTLRAANGDALGFAGAMTGAYSANQALVAGFKDNASGIRDLHQQIADLRLTWDGSASSVRQLADLQTKLGDAYKNSEINAINLNKGTIDYAKGGAPALVGQLSAIQDAAVKAASAVYQHEVATKGAKQAAVDAYKLYVNQTRGQFIDEATQLGLTHKQAKKLADQYFGMPKNVKTLIAAEGTNPIVTVLNKIGQLLANLTGQQWDIPVNILLNKLMNPGGTDNPEQHKSHHAAGGPVRDGYFTVGERGWELGHKRGNKVTIFDNKTSQKMTGMAHVPGFANGTDPKPKPTFSYGGIDYASQRAADNAAARDAQSKRQSIVSGGTSAIAALRAAAHNLMSTGADLKDAAKQMRDAAAAGRVSAATLARFTREDQRLTRLGDRRDSVRNRLGSAPSAPTAYDNLGTAKDAYRNARSSVSASVGAFDITTAGASQYGEPVTASGILAQIKLAAAKAKRFTSLLRRLIHEGLPRPLVEQLAQAGPAAYDQAQALASSTPAQMRGIQVAYRSITSSGDAAGRLVANHYYKAGVDSAQAIVNGLLSKESALTKAIKHLAEKMVKQLRTSLDMHSPSRVLFNEARLAFSGYENGIQSKHGDIARAAGRIGGASVPGRSGRAFGDVHHHYNIDKPELHVHYPLEGDLQEGVKQLARMLPQQIRAQTQGLDQ